MATDAQRSYIFDLVGDGITVRGTLVPGGVLTPFEDEGAES